MKGCRGAGLSRVVWCCQKLFAVVSRCQNSPVKFEPAAVLFDVECGVLLISMVNDFMAKPTSHPQFTCSFAVPDEPGMLALGDEMAKALAVVPDSGCIIYLHGDLGAGKTTLTRAILQGLGVNERIKSPTYTLVEPYVLVNESADDSVDGDSSGRMAYHFDLYRLGDPEELEYLGIRDYCSESAILLVEWPSRGEGVLPAADVHLYLEYAQPGRLVRMESAGSLRGQWLKNIQF